VSGLTPFEHAVLQKLLDGDHPTLRVLRQQLNYATVDEREWHGAAGFVTSLLVDLAAPSAGLEFSEDISDVVATIGGMSGPAVFVVFIGAGRLTALEGTGFDDQDWPDPITDFELSYLNEPRHMPPLGRRRYPMSLGGGN
jgi:hypothetical protein